MALEIESLRLQAAGGGEYRTNCPFCSDKGKHLWVNPAKGVYHCFRCGASGKIVGRNGHVPSAPAQARISRLAMDRPDPARLDSVYRKLLESLELSVEHENHLRIKRGLDLERIRRNAYRTLPVDSRLKIAEKVAETIDPGGVPGFYRYRGRNKWCLAGKPGLLIPVRDWEGRIRGLQIRRDQGDPRYVWLSSARYPGGTGAHASYHVAGSPKERVWITEGPLKADIAHALTGDTFVAVPGVTTWKATGLIEDMKSLGIKEVIIAYDADFMTNPGVARAKARFAEDLLREGFVVFEALWDISRGKGIDDLLLAGGVPTINPIKIKEPKGEAFMNQVMLVGYLAGKARITNKLREDGSNLAIGRFAIIEDPEDPKCRIPIPLIMFGAGVSDLGKIEPGTAVAVHGRISMSSGRDSYGQPATFMQVIASSVVPIKTATIPVPSKGIEDEEEVPF